MAEGYDYHFMILAPGLQSAWFFQAARQYWQRFQPIVTDDLELLTYPDESSIIAVTLLAREDTVNYMRVQIQDRLDEREDALLDVVVIDDLPSMESLLNERARDDVPFG